ncbi:MAG TPA: carboxylating nicotinate-nucleotide diphosphorylase [Elusimicrobia bacterium]|nr:carboxylating nicotinate-nucleotide diphosphorylase [Elusimicrobiota bacterium]
MDTKTIIKLALKEDTPKGDITTNTLIPKNKIISAKFVAKAAGVVCGLDIAGMVFKQLDKKIIFKKFVKDGQKVNAGRVIAKVTGKARAILTGERTALNFLQHLSGVATVTRMFVDKTGGKAKIYDTRKTTHLLRNLEKYAVRAGGGYNHRLNLSDMVLIKDNHLKILKNGKLKIKNLPKNKKVEIECQSFEQVKEFLKFKPDIIMLDNMDAATMKKCIRYIRNHSKCEIEISGNVNLKTVGKIASLKPDRISVGKITHSAHILDISLEF